MRITAAMIEAAKTPRGGWTRKTLESWGVSWPPKQGWKRRLTGSSSFKRADRNPNRGTTGTND